MSAPATENEVRSKERGIKAQVIDLKEKGMSKGELTSVLQSVGGFDALVNPNAKDKDTPALFKYIAEEDKLEKLLEITNVQAVHLNVFPENTRAKRCYESVGFSERKTDLNAFPYKEESWGGCNMIIRRS